MDFERKQLKTETLAEYLRECRNAMGLSQEEFSARSGVVLKHIAALEEGRYNVLPADIYVIGFLRQIAATLGIPDKDLIRQFKKEVGTQRLLQARHKKPIRVRWYSGISLTPKSLSVSLAFLLLLSFGFYIYVQIIKLNSSPNLVIYEPKADQVVTDFTLRISGKADPGTTVFINNQPLSLDSEGNFSSELNVSEGKQSLQFLAKNRFEKETVKNVTILANLPDASLSQQLSSAPREQPFSFSLSSLHVQSIDLYIDGTATPKNLPEQNKQIKVNARSDVILSTTKPETVILYYESKKLGTLSQLFPDDPTEIFLDKAALENLINKHK
ncbi:MAG TPA: helix-turn-helix transcriptional regulator [Patescibacteria group bacterium]|nr:helix-turn-helix transcriptional regulator [Patescibacteria group bacterium]